MVLPLTNGQIHLLFALEKYKPNRVFGNRILEVAAIVLFWPQLPEGGGCNRRIEELK